MTNIDNPLWRLGTGSIVLHSFDGFPSLTSEVTPSQTLVSSLSEAVTAMLPCHIGARAGVSLRPVTASCSAASNTATRHTATQSARSGQKGMIEAARKAPNHAINVRGAGGRQKKKMCCAAKKRLSKTSAASEEVLYQVLAHQGRTLESA